MVIETAYRSEMSHVNTQQAIYGSTYVYTVEALFISFRHASCILQVDDESPFLRESALWCIRNLCEGNPSIQQEIEDLQMVDVVDSPELQAAGIKLEHDPSTGKLKTLDRLGDI